MTDAYKAGYQDGIRKAVALADALAAEMELHCALSTTTKSKAKAIKDHIEALLDAPAPAGVTVQDAAQLICEEVLQKACPVAGMHRQRMINATLAVRIPSIPRAQRWAIVNAALRALSQVKP